MMRLCLLTDGLREQSLQEMLDTSRSLGFESLEFACGNWSAAPHLDLDGLLASAGQREKFGDAIKSRDLEIEALNCSGNQLAPNQEGKAHQLVVEKTFNLAELLGVKTIVMMSGLPGAGPNDTMPNWITTNWPPLNVQVLNWQWNEVALPYWEKTIKLAKEHGIEKIALENHGFQLVYNPVTLFKLRNQVGEIVGMNLDPSQLFWMGGDPVMAARLLGRALYHIHAKDVRFERGVCEVNGVIDPQISYADRAWNYVAVGRGHDTRWWSEFFAVVKMSGYAGPVSLEFDDQSMAPLVGIKKAIKVLQ
jgi:sugar phosphate isomerase/epimerase